MWYISYYPSEWGGYEWSIIPTDYKLGDGVMWNTRNGQDWFSVEIEEKDKETALHKGMDIINSEIEKRRL